MTKKTCLIKILCSVNMSLGIKNGAYPYDGVQFSHGDLLRSLYSRGHLLLMLQQTQTLIV